MEHYTFQDAVDNTVLFNLKPGFDIVCDIMDYVTGTKYEVAVLDPEGREVWWNSASTEEGGLDAIKRAVELFTA